MSTFTAKTVDEAIEKGLSELNLNKDNSKINIVQNSRKGFLGIGKRDAIVEIDKIVTSQPKQSNNDKQINNNLKSEAHLDEETEVKTKSRKDSNEEAVEDLVAYLAPIIKELGIEAKLDYEVINRKFARINFQTDQEGILIGKHGLTINALQSLAQIYLNHLGFSRLLIQLDTADYRYRRVETLKKLAEKTAREAVATGQPVYLDPMPSFERKVIHTQLENSSHVETYSSGRDPYRSVVVEAKII
ncbi:RNA-binding cell elongation regulator Jag/EloR [Apilactobacillus timberlakei]|uniref:RNA-binding protein KhpB n=1 Tax=Apilactobacillus timberlakei TaxID=2008380 RepID=A0ABY2YSQ4_9LACO|nr:RNA-binding cell elongation regulator Jag/EloR [Apilactobacillus timberlakei]TPR13284.1 protein jag [Apilactobacillus timberlakei]TPR14329.1 protein jag [Apilactobacillus timberlakei]TPR16582.1 protein jag [Apilactobacillus timberlakei]TPR19277.1 protein jag [Apilactobacillus timberlakei]TPR23198.1 protein jag [Apilactobacillus timberlakei]